MASKYNVDTAAATLVNDYAGRISGKIVLATGPSKNTLGGHFVDSIAVAKPGLLILAGRTAAKLKEEQESLAPTGVAVRLLEVDFASLASVRKAAETVNSWTDVPHIDLLMNNAGIMATDYAKTVDGFERQFGTNHLGPFLFTNLIMDKILAAKEPRIVNVSSSGHRLSAVRFEDHDFHDGESYNRWRAYGQSKTANILFALSLAQKLGPRGLTAFSLHPGTIRTTQLGKHVDWAVEYAELQLADKQLGNAEGWDSSFATKDWQQGTATHVFASFDPEIKAKNGSYCLDSHIADPLTDRIVPWALSSVEADRLWKLSEKLVGAEFSY